VSGQPYIPVPLSLGKRTNLTGGWWVPEQVWMYWTRKNFLPLLRLEPQIVQLVA